MTTTPLLRLLTALAASLAITALGASLVAGCGGSSGPRYTLQMVMFEVEASQKKMEASLLTEGDTGGVEAAARTIRDWLVDPAVDYYLQRRDLEGTAEQFRALQSSFAEQLERVLAAASAGDVQAAREAYPSLVDGCNACHAVFRPDLPR